MPDASARSTVHVHVLDNAGSGTPAVGIPVVFVDPDGILVATVASDGTGDASADVLPGASASAVYTYQGGFTIRSVLGLDAGRSLTLGSILNPPVTQTVTVDFPSNPNATYYAVNGPCGVTSSVQSTSIQMTGFDLCEQSNATLIVTAYDSSFQLVGYLEQPNVSLNDGATVNLAGTWQFGFDVSAAASNLASDVISASFRRCTPDWMGNCIIQNAAPAGGSAAAIVHGNAPSDIADMVTIAYKSNGAAQAVDQRIAGNIVSYSVDVGGTVGVWLGDPTLDLTTGHVTSPYTGTGTVDGVHAQIGYHDPTGNLDIIWLVDAPTLGDFDLPQLPIQVGDVMPHAGDTSYIDGTSTIHVAGSSGWSDYLDREPAPMLPFGPLRAGASSVAVSVSSAGPSQ